MCERCYRQGKEMSRVELSVLREENADLRRQLAEAEKKRGAAMQALESLTPGGSEYVGDPERCVAHVRDHQTHLTDLLKKTILDKRELKAENERLRGIVDALLSGDKIGALLRVQEAIVVQAAEAKEASDDVG